MSRLFGAATTVSQLAVLAIEPEKPEGMAINVPGMPRKRSGETRASRGNRGPIRENPHLSSRVRIWLKFAVWVGDNDYWAILELAEISRTSGVS